MGAFEQNSMWELPRHGHPDEREERPAMICEHNQCSIMRCETYYNFDFYVICKDCVMEALEEYKQDDHYNIDGDIVPFDELDQWLERQEVIA